MSDHQLQVTVYHNLRLLLEETDKQKFELLLKQTLEHLKRSNDTKNFAKYFEIHYAYKKEQWASCYRRDATVNTNMYVEAFHRVLKYVYLKGRVNKRLDKFIYILLKFARDKGFERLIKFEKGKSTERLSMISARHKSSLKLSFAQISPGDKLSTWSVTSSDEKQKCYYITLENRACPHKCALCCSNCNICVHIYMCDCADALIRATICKHIHLVARYLSEQSQQEQSSQPGTQASHPMSASSDENELLLETLLGLEHNQPDTVAMLRSKAQAELFTLSSQLSIVEDTEILKDVRHYIKLAINIIKAKSSTPNSKLIPTSSARREPANKQIEKQRSFFSMKRKRKHTQTHIRNPTATEKDDLSTALLEKCAALYGE